MHPITTAEVTKRFRASHVRLFASFADPNLVAQWLSPSAEIKLEVLAYDFRAGGTYRFAYHVPRSGVMRVNGEFRLIAPSTEINFSWNVEPPDIHAGLRSEVHIQILELAGGAELRIRHTNLDIEGAAGRHREGWIAAMNRLQILLGSREGGEWST
jgi:uncharacterized protein YndB with AHSA1/START domain